MVELASDATASCGGVKDGGGAVAQDSQAMLDAACNRAAGEKGQSAGD